LRNAAAGLARLGLAAALIWVALTAWEDSRSRRHLAMLEGELASQAATVAVLETEYTAIRESSLERAAGTRALLALASLRRHVEPPIYLEHLNYVQGQGVTLRGGAPGNEQVLEMMERLATDPLWRSLRVMQLRSEKTDGVDRVHFVVEGRLN
jgi:Tfp pilus assembly protein PilN